MSTVLDPNDTTLHQLPRLKIVQKYPKCSLTCLLDCYFPEILFYYCECYFSVVSYLNVISGEIPARSPDSVYDVIDHNGTSFEGPPGLKIMVKCRNCSLTLFH